MNTIIIVFEYFGKEPNTEARAIEQNTIANWIDAINGPNYNTASKYTTT